MLGFRGLVVVWLAFSEFLQFASVQLLLTRLRRKTMAMSISASSAPMVQMSQPISLPSVTPQTGNSGSQSIAPAAPSTALNTEGFLGTLLNALV